MVLRRLFVMAVAASCTVFPMAAQIVKPLPSLHVEGRNLVDTHGNKVVLHGVMDTPHPYFNGGRWGWDISDTGVSACLNYFDRLFAGMTDASQGAFCNVFRLHLDPCWTNDPAKEWVGKSGEHNISRFSADRLRKYMLSLYVPLMTKAMNHGLYVVVRPPGVCPDSIAVGDKYQEYLMTVWDIVSRNADVLKYAGQISLELANEPVRVHDAAGRATPNALHDYFQPVVDIIRRNGFKGIIWVPGSGWQGNYVGYARFPITDTNFGYAVHNYPGWYGTSDQSHDADNGIRQFKNLVPVVDTHPIIITEVDWSPHKPGTGHYNEHGAWVESNYGTWATATTSKWGMAYKKLIDHYDNISMTLSGTGCYLDIDTLLQKGKVVAAFPGIAEACGEACMEWYRDYNKRNKPFADGRVFSAAENQPDSIRWNLKDTMLLVGNSISAPLKLYYPDGRCREVPFGDITYTVSAPGVVEIGNGEIRAVGDGSARITATHTTVTGKTFSREFTVRSYFFSFDSRSIRTDFFSQGTYDEATRTFRPGLYGQMGWQFGTGADFSRYRYLVLKLDRPQNCGGKLMLFPQPSIWGDGYEAAIDNRTTLVVDLATATTRGGKKLNETPVYIVSLWGSGSGDIDVADIYLTNNADFTPAGILNVHDAAGPLTDVCTLHGIRVRSKVRTDEAVRGLPSGIYIMNGKKVIVK